MRRRDFLGTSLSGLAAFGLGGTALGGLGRRALAEVEETPEAPNVFFPPVPSLEIRNPWGKVLERSGLKFEHFC